MNRTVATILHDTTSQHLAWGASLLLLSMVAACGGGGGSSAGASGNSPGDVIDHPDASGSTSKHVIVDANKAGNEQNLKIEGFFWGRLVDVYDQNGAGERTLQQKDYPIGEDIISDGSDYLMETNPVTQQTIVVILHPVDDPTGSYDIAFSRLDKNLEVISPVDLSSTGVFSMVPRNAVIVIRFNDLLDTSLIDADTVRVFTGSPPEVPFEFRLEPDPNHGDVLTKGGTPRFYPTRILIDTTVTELESFESEDPLPVNGVGLPASISANLASVLVRIPTLEKPSVGQDIVLRNLSGHKLATTGNGPVDFSSPTVDVVRAFRAGGNELVTGDPFNGFLRDEDQPGVVGRQPIVIVEPPVTDSTGIDEFDFVLPEVQFLSTFCAQDPQPGDILRQSGVFAQVREAPSAPEDGGVIFNLKVRLLLGNPSEWLVSGVGSAEYLSIFDPVVNQGQQSCFVQIIPTPEGFPLEPAEGLVTEATISVRFSEPMDPASMTAFDSLTLTRVAEPLFSYEYVVGRVVQSQDLQSFTFVPDLPLAHKSGDTESYFLTLAEGDLGPSDLAGNSLADLLPQIECTIDPNATTQVNGGRVTRFTSADEEPPFGDDTTGSLPEWNGQHLIDLERQLIHPRPLIRYEGVADRTQPVPSLHTPFAPGVQTPLSGMGSKMQTVWRYCDFGYSLTDLTNVNIDVEGMWWSPIGGNVIADHYNEFEIRLCHALYLPDEFIDPASLFPMWPNSGLKKTYTVNLLDPVNDPQKIVHEKFRGYTINPADLTQTVTGTLVMPYPLNRDLPIAEHTFYTWRDTALQARGGAQGGGADNNVLCQVFGVGKCGLMSAGQVETIGMPILMEFRCYPDVEALGLNALDISLAANSSARPDFRAFSTGGQSQSGPVIRDPDTETDANGGFNPNSNPPGAATWGLDNTFYIGALDFVTRVSRTYSVWFPVTPAEITNPGFNPPVTEPRPEDQPNGTDLVLAFRGASAITNQSVLDDANTLDGYGDHYADPSASRDLAGANVGVTFLNGDTTWHTEVSDLNGATFYQVRVTFHSNPETATDAELSALGLTWVQN
jgi:hypothetical protein